MDFKVLQEIQRELDFAIMKPRGLDYNSTFERRKIAALVELGEVANEIRFFKFWSNKGRSEKVLEELVDVLHFVLSLFNAKDEHVVARGYYVGDMVGQFKALYRVVNEFEGNGENLASLFLGLAEELGYSEEELFEAYMEKNKINYKRQEEGY